MCIASANSYNHNRFALQFDEITIPVDEESVFEDNIDTFRIEPPYYHKEQKCVKSVSSTVSNFSKLIAFIFLVAIVAIVTLHRQSIAVEEETKALGDHLQSLLDNMIEG